MDENKKPYVLNAHKKSTGLFSMPRKYFLGESRRFWWRNLNVNMRRNAAAYFQTWFSFRENLRSLFYMSCKL